MSLRLQRLRTLAELDGLQASWRTLECVEGGPSIFQSWTWNRLWCDEVLPQRKSASLDVRVVEDGAGRPLAILPFFTEWLGGPMASITQFLGHRMSSHNDMLLAEPTNWELAEYVVHLLLNDLGAATVLHLRNLAEDSLVTQCLRRKGIAEPQCPRLYLQADAALEDPIKRLGKSSRKTYLNLRNRLHRRFTVEVRPYSGSNFLNAFDQLMALHQKRFAEQRRTTQLVGANLRFLRRATAALSTPDSFEVLQLLADGVPIAAELLAYDRGRCFGVQRGFDPAFAQFSPAKILFTEVLRRSFESHGCHIMDLGPGYEAYKYEWSPTVGTNYMCSYGEHGLYAKSVAALYRVAFRHSLPAIPQQGLRKALLRGKILRQETGFLKDHQEGSCGQT